MEYLLDSENFIKHCESLGLEITKSDLELCKHVGLIEPIRKNGQTDYYSIFQSYCIDRAKPYISFELDRRNDVEVTAVKVFARDGKIFLRATLHLEIEIAEAEALPTSGGGTYKPLEHAPALEERFRNRVSGKEALDYLQNTLPNLVPFLKFLVAIEDVYLPYAKSGGSTIQVTGDSRVWHRRKAELDLQKEMAKQGLAAGDLAEWYKRFANMAGSILGAESDWLQIWRNVSWSKKEKLSGDIRKGVEYLQWALMIKRILEENLQREIFDIDEIHNLTPKDIITLDTKSTSKPHLLARDWRNKRYSDNNKNYYEDRYKRLLYLSNDFGLNYQPKVMVFVEGPTEEKILPKMFMDLFGVRHEQMGIEFVTLGGITNFFGSLVGRGANRKVISNFKSTISYNLDKWQTIPFFVGDNENDILSQLITGECLHFNRKDYKLPDGWYALWGQDTEFTSAGKDFELANYTNRELVLAITGLDGSIAVTESQIGVVRSAGQGVKQLPAPYGEQVDALKIDLAKKLYDNLKAEYLETKDDELLKRPVFKVVRRIYDIAALNHAPHDRTQELANRGVIEDVLEGRRPAW
ncbi:MAG TPA: TOPRIM nucleotidyl transferase/hydrolase domain-containing protein [Candidatus Saccharimonadales bacterium]|nr:TOPRIM nucleotidyl transferase/hydrolase domain-containing protein [Candidatus Saccharimonadales bacterium]